MSQKTVYIQWMLSEARMGLGIWDAQVFDGNRPPWEQLDTVLFWDTFTLASALDFGASLIHIAVLSNKQHIKQLRDQKLLQQQEAEMSKPVTEEELRKMSVFVEGLQDVDLELKEPPHE